MRIFVMLGTLAAVTLIGIKPGIAYYEGPWCIKANMGRGAVIDICHYRTFKQCFNDRFFYGNTSFCIQNPRYLPYWKARGKQKPHKSP